MDGYSLLASGLHARSRIFHPPRQFNFDAKAFQVYVVSFTVKIIWFFIPSALLLLAALWFAQPDPGAEYCRWHANMIETNIQENVALLKVVNDVAASTEHDPNNLTGYVEAHANAAREQEFVFVNQARIHADRELAQFLDQKREINVWLCLGGSVLCSCVALLFKRIIHVSAVPPPPAMDATRSGPPPQN